MKNIVSPILALSLALSATSAFAGGPVVVEEEGQPEVVAELAAFGLDRPGHRRRHHPVRDCLRQ